MYTTYSESRDTITVKDRPGENLFQYLKLKEHYPAAYPAALMHLLLGISEWFFANPYVVYCPGMVGSQMHSVVDFPNEDPASLETVTKTFQLIYDQTLKEKEYRLVRHIYVAEDMILITCIDLPPIQQDFLQLDSRLHHEQRKFIMETTIADL